MKDKAQVQVNYSAKIYIKNHPHERRNLFTKTKTESRMNFTSDELPPPIIKAKTKVQVETEKYVDEHIKNYGYPPTYKEIEKYFKIDASAAHARCRNFRYKMRRNDSPETIVIKIPPGISKDKMKRFFEAVKYARKILK